MKKLIYIAAIILMSAAAASAQNVSMVTSWGSYQPWDVPVYVSDVVYHRYNAYDWVLTKRIVRNGHFSYRVVLQRGPQFMEVTMNRFGNVRRVRHYDYFPMYNENLPRSYHVTYRPGPGYTWSSYYDYPTHVNVYNKTIYRHYDYHGPKHHVHKHKGGKHKHKANYHNERNRRPDPIVVKSQSRERRQGTMRELEEDRQRRSREGNRSAGRTYRSRRVN